MVKKGKGKGFKLDQTMVFFISGAIFMVVMAAINYAVMQNMTVWNLLINFLFGGLVGHLAMSKKDTFLKNTVFIAAVAWIIWALLNPIDTVGGNLIIKKTELMAIIAFVIILVEREFVNSIRRMKDKPAKFRVGFFGAIAILILLGVSGINSAVGEFLGKHWYVLLALLLGWFIFLFIMLTKKFGSITNKLAGKITKGRKK